MFNSASKGKRIGYGWLYNRSAAYEISDWEPGPYLVSNIVRYNDNIWICIIIVSGASESVAPFLGSDYWEIYEDIPDNIISPNDWRLPSSQNIDFENLVTHLGGSTVAGGKVKSINNEWAFPNTNASNESGLSFLPGGSISNTGTAGLLHNNIRISAAWSGPYTGTWIAVILRSTYDSGEMGSTTTLTSDEGFYLRCVQDKLFYEEDGEKGTLEDIDGNIYEWIVIGDLRWMTENLRVTKFRDGTLIPKAENSTDWMNSVDGTSGSTTLGPIRAAYNYDDYYVYPPYKETPLPKVTIEIRSNRLGEWVVGNVVLQELSDGTWSNVETEYVNNQMPITVNFDTITHTNKRIILSNLSIKDGQFGTPEPPLIIEWSLDLITFYSNDIYPNEFFPNKTIYFKLDGGIK